MAQLAGLPASVTARAKEILCVLEKENTKATQILEESKSVKKQRLETERRNPALDALSQVDVNSITPIQALQKLADLKKQASDFE